jgi:Thoeris protein ThsB, TIR-like domain
MGLYNPPSDPFSGLLGYFGSQDWLESLNAPKRRKAFFSFHFDDVMRVNAVRNAWRFRRPGTLLTPSFYDSSLWENRQREGDEALRRLIREGVDYTSAVCILIGRNTWARRWVRYEIARAVVDGRGLLGVHINSIRHHQTRMPDGHGPNPLEFMAIGKIQENWLVPAKYYLFERDLTHGWLRYQDYPNPVRLPPYLSDPAPGYVTPLSWGTLVRDFMADDGPKNIGLWIDLAAQAVGR